MAVLILKNAPNEGPGTIEPYLSMNRIPYRIVDLQAEPFPEAEGSDALVMLGGPMSVNDEAYFPYLTDEMKLAERFIKEGRKVFGVCLGAQLMARALGARVYPGPEKEIGWYDIELVSHGLRDRLMTRLAIHPRAGDFWRVFRVFQWHGETFDMPAGADLLARSTLYPHQAFRCGTSAYAFQFHIEATKEMINGWLSGERVDHVRISDETNRYYDDCSRRAEAFYRGFFEGCGKRTKTDEAVAAVGDPNKEVRHEED